MSTAQETTHPTIDEMLKEFPDSPYKLPKEYLSYSAISMWYSNKPGFRSRYYIKGSKGGLSTPEMDYGKELADDLKDRPDAAHIAHVPKYEVRDEGFMVDVFGVRVLMYPDTLSLIGTPKFREYKSSVYDESSLTWTQKKVDEHMQLDIYSMGIKKKYGAVEDLCHLDWMVTEKVPEESVMRIGGHAVRADLLIPRITDKLITFERIVTEIQRYRAKEWIVQAANEIQEDYKKYLKEHEGR